MGLRDEALLQSAVATPQATSGGAAIITDGAEIAAAYLFYLCRNHPFIDGNKRTALATCLVFLAANHILIPQKLAVNEWEKLTLDLAASKLDRAQTTARLRALLPKAKPVPKSKRKG